jgi:cysteine synthase A
MSDSSVLGAIGNTPIVQLTRPNGASVWVKLEAANPTGSYKDRMALAMIRGAEADGRLSPGQPVLEYTGGSTGSSLAFVCALTDHPLHIITADAFAAEKIDTMRAFGADVEVLSSPEGITPDLITRLRTRAGQKAAALGAHQTDQFTNRDMLDGYRGMGIEAVAQVPHPIDAVAMYVGTAGAFLGVTRVVRESAPKTLRVAVEPAESQVLSGGEPGTHRIEGGGVGFFPDLLQPSDFDRVVAISTDAAINEARRATREDGIWGGPSTGANLAAAAQVADELAAGAHVLTFQVDSGLKYLSGSTYTD